jgi:hypothetical protein
MHAGMRTRPVGLCTQNGALDKELQGRHNLSPPHTVVVDHAHHAQGVIKIVISLYKLRQNHSNILGHDGVRRLGTQTQTITIYFSCLGIRSDITVGIIISIIIVVVEICGAWERRFAARLGDEAGLFHQVVLARTGSVL